MNTPGGLQNFAIINESGLYSLLFALQPTKARGVSDEYIEKRCKELKRFKRWVTSEVLPSIRRHGMYATDELIANPDLAIAAFQALKQERERVKELNQTVSVQQQQIFEMTRKIDYYDIVLNCSDTVSVTRIAKDYGWSVKRLHNYLHEKGVLTKRGKIWLLEPEYVNKGYTKTKVRSDNEGKFLEANTRWTPAGRLFIHGLLKSNGILPLIERKRG